MRQIIGGRPLEWLQYEGLEAQVGGGLNRSYIALPDGEGGFDLLLFVADEVIATQAGFKCIGDAKLAAELDYQNWLAELIDLFFETEG